MSSRNDTWRCVHVVVEDRRKPLFRFAHAPAFAPGIVFDLIALDLADPEIGAVRVTEIKAAYRRSRPHREAFGKLHANAFASQQIEQRSLLDVIGLRGIAGCRAN